jgi:hypothetical protein
MDVTVFELLGELPREHIIYVLVLAVLIAPWIYRWRLRVRRILVRLAWIGLGVAVGVSL